MQRKNEVGPKKNRQNTRTNSNSFEMQELRKKYSRQGRALKDFPHLWIAIKNEDFQTKKKDV